MGLLRSLFGPSQKEVWSELARRVDGHFMDGGFWGRDMVVITHGEWTITLDTYKVSTGRSSKTCTRMRAPYVNADQFRFEVYREGLFSSAGRLLGMQDVEIGDPYFDENFVIKGNSEGKLRAFFSEPRIRRALHHLSDVHFEIKDNEGFFSGTPEGVDVLSFTCWGVLKNLRELEALYVLFAESLNQLCRIGSAYENDPEHPELAPPIDDGWGVAMGEAGRLLSRSGSEGAGTGAPVALPVLPREEDV